MTVTAKTPNGVEQFQADWLAGADGGAAPCAKPSIWIRGHTWPERFLVASTTDDYAGTATR